MRKDVRDVKCHQSYTAFLKAFIVKFCDTWKTDCQVKVETDLDAEVPLMRWYLRRSIKDIRSRTVFRGNLMALNVLPFLFFSLVLAGTSKSGEDN